jgi:hypothetical protein
MIYNYIVFCYHCINLYSLIKEYYLMDDNKKAIEVYQKILTLD